MAAKKEHSKMDIMDLNSLLEDDPLEGPSSQDSVPVSGPETAPAQPKQKKQKNVRTLGKTPPGPSASPNTSSQGRGRKTSAPSKYTYIRKEDAFEKIPKSSNTSERPQETDAGSLELDYINLAGTSKTPALSFVQTPGDSKGGGNTSDIYSYVSLSATPEEVKALEEEHRRQQEKIQRRKQPSQKKDTTKEQAALQPPKEDPADKFEQTIKTDPGDENETLSVKEPAISQGRMSDSNQEQIYETVSSYVYDTPAADDIDPEMTYDDAPAAYDDAPAAYDDAAQAAPEEKEERPDAIPCAEEPPEEDAAPEEELSSEALPLEFITDIAPSKKPAAKPKERAQKVQINSAPAKAVTKSSQDSSSDSLDELDFLEEVVLESDRRTPLSSREASKKSSLAAASARSKKAKRNPEASGFDASDDFFKEDYSERNNNQKSRHIPVHLILPVIILIIAVVAVVRFLIWNQGVDININSEDNANRFNVEVNDSMVILSDSALAGAVDDGITTILCLGNEPFSQDTSESGLAGQIAALGDCTVINAAFPDSQVTCENATYSTESLDEMDDIFNLFYVSYAISIGDFTSLQTVASAHTEDSTYSESVETLMNTDFSTVDIIAIMYDGIDYINGMAMQNPDVPEELTTYVGSLTNSFALLQEAYPYIRIIFLSPYYAEYDGVSSRTTDLGNGTIVDYFQWGYDTCGSCSVSFLDNYYGSINENNFSEYLSDDIHLNSAGCTKIADHFVYKVIEENYAEYNVEEMAIAQ